MLKKAVLLLIVLHSFSMHPTNSMAKETAMLVSPQSIVFSDLVKKSSEPIEAILRQKNISLENSSPEASLYLEDIEKTQERLLNVFLNALNGTPDSTRIITNYVPSERKITINLPDKPVRFEVYREITDTVGNKFTLESSIEKGTTYSIKL